MFAGLASHGQARAEAPMAGDLGIGVEILPTDTESPAQLGANSELWFAVEPGQSAERRFRVISTSEIVQRVSFELWQLVVVDGKPTIDRTTRSPSEGWVSYDPPAFDLEPRSRRDVTMTYRIPVGTEPAVFESYLRILVSARDTAVDENSEAGVRAIVKGALAFRKSVWLGIGDAATLATDFEIQGVAGWLTDKNEKAIRVLIANTGGTPIRPTGTVRLVDPQFAENSFGPFQFQTNSINPGETAFADAVVDPTIAEGQWSLFVQATQGSIRKTAKFEKEIRFDRNPTFDEKPIGEGGGWNSQRIILILLSILLLVLAKRNLQGDTKPSVGRDDGAPKQQSPFSQFLSRLQQNWESSQTSDELTSRSATESAPRILGLPDERTDVIAASADLAAALSPSSTLQPATEPRLLDESPVDAIAESMTPPSTSAPSTLKQTPNTGSATAHDDLHDDPVETLTSNAEALRLLKALFEEGIISEDEYARKRREILGRF